MPTKYVHTNIVCDDWRLLVEFYESVFDCELVPPVRNQSGEWLSVGTGVENASLQGAHLRLPGYGDDGPTLEIYTYDEMFPRPESVANRKGFGHLAFTVDDVADKIAEVERHGGRCLGQIVSREVPEVGTITFAYATDPEGNIIEIQRWD